MEGDSLGTLLFERRRRPVSVPGSWPVKVSRRRVDAETARFASGGPPMEVVKRASTEKER